MSMFQLTAPLWEPTQCTVDGDRILLCFNSRLPCGSRPHLSADPLRQSRFNSRLPCGSRPSTIMPTISSFSRFNSRLPCGSRREAFLSSSSVMMFQLTAPLREPTSLRAFCSWHDSCFNSRLPCGSRRVLSLYKIVLSRFHLTAPLREPPFFKDSEL